jgi:tetratricopeptide (TPR) repeat protein
LFGIVTLVVTTLAHGTTTPHERLAEAVGQYRAAMESTDRAERLERFGRAELLFAQLVTGAASAQDRRTSGIRNADLYVNLGNAALGAERIGPAVLAYRRALAIDPDHARARQNLEHARSLLPDWLPRPQGGSILDTFFAWTGQISNRQLQLAAAVSFLCAAIMMAASIRWRRPILRHLATLPTLIWALLVGIMMIRSTGATPNAAVVVVPETIARAADSAHAPTRFSQPLPSGAEVEIVEQRDQWSHIRLADGRDAWVNNSALESVSESPSGRL